MRPKKSYGVAYTLHHIRATEALDFAVADHDFRPNLRVDNNTCSVYATSYKSVVDAPLSCRRLLLSSVPGIYLFYLIKLDMMYFIFNGRTRINQPLVNK